MQALAILAQLTVTKLFNRPDNQQVPLPTGNKDPM